MSRHKSPTSLRQRGFTLIELLVVMIIALVISGAFYVFFKSSLFTYLNLQKEASNFTGLARQSQRVSNVVRGLTDIVSAGQKDVVIYAYFYPTDTYVSLVHYYLNTNETTLYADVTPMTANPPLGTPITSQKQTYTIIENFQQTAGVDLFEYLDSSGDKMGLPIADLHTVKGMRVNLAVASSSSSTNQAVSAEVSLRNRKTNL